jgi:(R,R)-butanediol dehydrogenase/meso-butanediol dehydrogenase/diacetyl reductase
MRALTLYGNRDLRLDEIPVPPAPGPGEVALQTRLVGICGTDLHEWSDGPLQMKPEPHPLTGATLPQILGHEYSAEVVAVGEGVRSVCRGDRVAVMPLFYCGQCSGCRAGEFQTCDSLAVVGIHYQWGGMADISIVRENQVFVLPEGMTDAQGAVVEPAGVAVHAVDVGGVTPGDKVFVAGGGPIGQLVALAAVAAGAGEVYLAETNPRRLAQAVRLGLTDVLDSSSGEVGLELWDRASGGIDVALECAGVSAALADCIASVKKRGMVVQTAVHTRPANVDMHKVALRDITIRGEICYPPNSWPRVMDLITSGRLPAERIITGTVPLERAVSDAFESLADPEGEHLKILLEV